MCPTYKHNLPRKDAHNHVLASWRRWRHPWTTHHQGGSLGIASQQWCAPTHHVRAATLINPMTPPRLKFHQEVGCPALEKHGHICRKDVTALATIVKKSNKKPPRTPYQPRQTEARRASEETGSETASARQVHSPSIPTTESPPQPPPSLINFTASSSRHKYHPSSESSSAGALVERVHRTLLARFGWRSSVWGNGK